MKRDDIRYTFLNHDKNMNVFTTAIKIASDGQKIVGSSLYYWALKEELAATIRKRLFENDELPSAFHSSIMSGQA